MFHFFAYLSRMKHIKRWGLMRNTEVENIKEHSMDVAMIAHGLALVGNTYFGKEYLPEHVMAVAVYHEAGEVITGDLATPIKYFNPEINAAYKKIEAVAEEKLLSMLPGELEPQYRSLIQCKDESVRRLVKAADKICAYLKCVEEMKTGNEEFSKAKNQIWKDLSAIDLPEVKYFIEHMLPSYELTLDELN